MGNRSLRRSFSSPSLICPFANVQNVQDEKGLRCSYKQEKEGNVTYDVRKIDRFGLKMFLSLSPFSLSPHLDTYYIKENVKTA